MDRVKFIEYKSKKVLDNDYSEIRNDEEFLEQMNFTFEAMQSQPEKSVLSLLNVQDASFTPSLVAKIKDNLGKNDPYIKKSAAYGVAPMAAIVINGISRALGRTLKIHPSREEALEWLIGE